MRLTLILVVITLISGCTTSGSNRSMFDRLEFDEDEVGCFRLNGAIDTNSNPFISSNITVNLVKKKGEGPEC